MTQKRPRANDEIIMQAAIRVAEALGDADAKSIADHYRDPMDGYELAKELDKWCGWDITKDEVDILDDMHWIVYELVKDAEKRWQIENNIRHNRPATMRRNQQHERHRQAGQISRMISRLFQ